MKHLLLLGLLLALFSCQSAGKAEVENDGAEMEQPEESNAVTVMTLERRAFEHEIVSNGKVQAQRFADLRFRTSSEPIARIYVKNGSRVTAGQKLAELDLFTLQNRLKQAENSLSQAELEMKDVLIGQGYAPEQTDIPAEVMQLARVKSGYEQSLANCELAKFELQQAVLTAPFDGTVANLFAKPSNLPDTGEPFCRIIGAQGMEVAFKVLESELPLISRGSKVEITPYASATTNWGLVSEINPVVDADGMVSVKATVGGGQLLDGMNVRVSVKRSVPGQLVIPKTAVVLRSGRQVVFTLKEGKAQWNYVQTGLENMTEYTVTGDGMEPGAVVIVTGNVNLAHDTEI